MNENRQILSKRTIQERYKAYINEQARGTGANTPEVRESALHALTAKLAEIEEGTVPVEWLVRWAISLRESPSIGQHAELNLVANALQHTADSVVRQGAVSI